MRRVSEGKNCLKLTAKEQKGNQLFRSKRSHLYALKTWTASLKKKEEKEAEKESSCVKAITQGFLFYFMVEGTTDWLHFTQKSTSLLQE